MPSSTSRRTSSASTRPVHTAQARLYLDTKLFNALGFGSVHLPIYTELAEAQAKLASISCQGQGNATVALNLLPSVSSLAVANITPSQLSSQPRSPSFPPFFPPSQRRVVAKTHIDLGGSNTGWQQTSFSPNDIAAHSMRIRQRSSG